jgi:hypothetical protein
LLATRSQSSPLHALRKPALEKSFPKKSALNPKTRTKLSPSAPLCRETHFFPHRRHLPKPCELSSHEKRNKKTALTITKTNALAIQKQRSLSALAIQKR